MKPGPVVVPLLSIALAFIVPATASAQTLQTAAPWSTPLASSDRPGPATLAMLRASAGQAAPTPFGRTPAEIRLSEGAKTAIIVGAIVGGILIIVGVIALRKPGKL